MNGKTDRIDALSLDKACDLFESGDIDRVEVGTPYKFFCRPFRATRCKFFGSPYKFLGCGCLGNPA